MPNRIGIYFRICNCLYCHNWHFKEQTFTPKTCSIKRLVSDSHSKTSCICFFGGDPVPQLPYALAACRQMLEENKNRIFRICWETNGSMHPRLLDRMVDLSIDTGGCIKFDL